MRNLVYVILFFAFTSFGSRHVYTQTIPNTANENLRRQMEQAARTEADLERRMRDMRQLESKMAALSRLDSRVVKSAPSIDKKTRERVLRLRRVDPQDAEKYSLFLQGAKTGMFRLFPDFECVTKNVIRVDGDCETFVPESSSFSFRTGNYTDQFYHDIGLKRDEILSNAFFSQGILVSLGNVPIEDVTLAHVGLKYLVDFQPDLLASGARKTASGVLAGIESGGYKYAGRVHADDNTTFALRSVAYKIANSLPPVSEDTSITELRFLSLAFDKREDVIVVFRIIRKEPDGNVTILWKLLDRKDAPKIKFGKGEKIADFASAK